ncbi:MAG: 7TM diverse intracellular signaling domain-containing protein, partial [Marinobacter alexandrii]
MKHTANPVALFWLALVALLSVNQANADAAVIRWFQDAGQLSNIDEVLAREPDRWQSIGAGRGLNLGFSDSTYWIQVVVAPESENQVLEISYPLLDEVDLFWVLNGRVIRSYETGDARPFSNRPVDHRNFVFPVPSNTEPITAYVRVKTQGAVQVPVEVETAAEFLAGEQLSYGWQTMFLGIIVALALYNLFLFAIIRQPTYLWYVLTVVLSGLVHLHFKGILFQWLWPELPGLNRYVTIPLTGLTMIAALVFSLQFLAVSRYSKASYRFLQVLMVGAGIGIVIGAFGAYQTAITLVAVLAAIATPAAWFIGIYVWSRGQRLAGIYVLAWAPLLLGHLILAVSKLGYLPTTFLTEFGPQIGVAVEVILLSFALAYRINLERQRRLRAQERALGIQRQANQTLEERVRERTEELERANRRLEAISLTDGLTQVANRRQFDGRLKEEWCRVGRQGLPISLLLLD